MPFLGKVPSQLVDSDVDIDGGSIDGVAIGSVTANAGAFTNLTATGTLTLPDDAISGDDIDGGTISNVAISGTTASFSGDLTVDTNTLYVDSTNNQVGVGVTPASLFNAGGNLIVNQSGGTVPFVKAFRATTGNDRPILQTESSVGVTATFAGDGNVGIGDIVPAEKLTVEGNVRINKQPTATNGITWDLNTTNFGSIKMDGTENMLFDVDKSTAGFIFGSGSSEYVRIDSTGFIGVNTDAPVSQLHLQQTLSQNESATYITLENRNGSGASANSIGIDFHAGAAISASPDRRARIIAEGSNSGGDIDLAFHVSDNSSSSEAMRITNTKRVGINETDPSFPLEVNGGTGDGIKIKAGNSVNDDSFLIANSSDSSLFKVSGSGHALIGVDTGSAFNTDSLLRIQAATGGRAFVQLKSDADQRCAILLGDTDDAVRGEINYDNASDAMYFSVNDSQEAVRIDSSRNTIFKGSVGIGSSGASNPESLLHIEGNDSPAEITLGRSGSNSTGHALGSLKFKNEDGSLDGPNVVAYIQASSFNTNGSGGYLTFGTHDGSEGGEGSAPVERMQITAVGQLILRAVKDDTTSDSANMNIRSSDGLVRRVSSSRRYKNSIVDSPHGLDELLALRSVRYKGNNDGDKIFGGFIAEEVHEAGLNEFVQYNEENEPDALAYAQMVALCTKAIQEQQAMIEDLQTRLSALEAN